jgi:hypothetical protein
LGRRLRCGGARQRFASCDRYLFYDPAAAVKDQDAAAERFNNCWSEQVQTFCSDKQDIRAGQVQDPEQPLFRKQGIEGDVAAVFFLTQAAMRLASVASSL